MADKHEESIEQYDHEVHWRCPQLGGEVTFRYCRKLLGGLPCARLIGCWHTVFDVRGFLERHYDPQAIEAAWGKPRADKIVQLSDLVVQTQGSSSAASGPRHPDRVDDRPKDSYRRP